MTVKLLKAPCKSCPYRRDVPSGIWSAEEYDKLPEYDGPLHAQSPAAFFCHKYDGNLCAGWVGCHDMGENLAIKLALSYQHIDTETFEAAMDYETSVPVFASGAEAAEHGKRDIEHPSERAIKMITDVIGRSWKRGRDLRRSE